jgi:epoxyqueuosine reductase
MNRRIRVDRLQKEMKSQLLHSGADFVGFADISDLGLSKKVELRSAVAIGISFDRKRVCRLDSEIDAFEKHYLDTKKRMESLLKVCDQYLRRNEFATWVPPISKNLPGLLGDFSHKTAATKSGLGWVGKSSLFVSTEFGPGVRLATVLTSAPFGPAKPATESRCGECIECVRACPYGAIKGAAWYPGIARDKLLDAFLCSKKREEYIPKLGYKHPCGLCIQACPVERAED